jgi:hypothetical protein
MGEQRDKRIAELEAENARLLDIVQRGPATAYLEATQRAIVERSDYLKHSERAARAALDEAQAIALHSIEVAAPGLKPPIREAIARNIALRIRARAALQDRAPAEGEVDSSILSSSTTLP